MPKVDFGTVTAFVDDGRIDVFFPRGYDGLKNALKDMKGRWNPDRKCWSLEPRYARMESAAIVGRIGEVLLRNAPDRWEDAVKRFGGFACASRKYEVKVGLGGIRIRIPEGHPSHYVLKEVEGGQQEGKDTWLIPSMSSSSPTIGAVLERVVGEDRECFISYVEHLETRTIRGTVPVTPGEADRLGLVPGGFAYADHAFLRVADPQVKNGPIHAWPFKVLSRDDAEGGVEVRLSYLPPETAYKAVRHRQAQAEEVRLPLLDLTHAVEKWTYKRL